MKPRLPEYIEALLPEDIVRHIYKFVPHLKKERVSSSPLSRSPNAMRDLRVIQARFLQSVSASKFLYDLEDFILDSHDFRPPT